MPTCGECTDFGTICELEHDPDRESCSIFGPKRMDGFLEFLRDARNMSTAEVVENISQNPIIRDSIERALRSTCQDHKAALHGLTVIEELRDPNELGGRHSKWDFDCDYENETKESIAHQNKMLRGENSDLLEENGLLRQKNEKLRQRIEELVGQ